MVRILRQRQEHGESDSPLTLDQLARLADPSAAKPTILAASNPRRKAFGLHAISARSELNAPVALLDDMPQLVASPALLLFLLSAARTRSNHVASAADVKKKLTSKLRPAFQEALQRRIAEEALPPGVGWLLIRNTKKLFLLEDVHTGRGCQRSATEYVAPSAEPTKDLSAVGLPPPMEHDLLPTFDTAFAKLDRQSGGHNFVSLVDLRRELPLARDAFDAELRRERLAGRYTLSAAEGRHGLSPSEQEAGIVEDGTLLLYVSRKSS
jgi:hypothetical protein